MPSGVIDVNSGGELTSSGVVRSGDDPLLGGIATLRDTGSEWDTTLGTFDDSRYTLIGDGGTGDLEILNGAILRSFRAIIDADPQAEDPPGGSALVDPRRATHRIEWSRRPDSNR